MNPLLLHVLQPHPDPGLTRRLAGATSDWDGVLQDAAAHGLFPLLAWTVNRTCPDVVPGPVLLQLQTRLRANAEHVLGLSAELVRILDRFRDAGIPVVPFKGPAVAWSLYETPAVREMVDLDILVRPEHTAAALHVLRQSSYVPAYEVADTQLYPWRELPLARNDGRFAIDLHWGLLPDHFRLDPEPLFERLTPVTVAGREVSTFCPEDLLLFLCVHGSKHAWCSLHWLADVIRLLDRYPGTVEPASARARDCRLSRPFEVGLSLARSSAPVFPRGGHLYQLQLMHDWNSRLQYIRSLLTPTPAEWLTLRLPSGLYPAYFLLRPVRLAAKYTNRLLGL